MLGDQLRFFRKQADLSQEQLSEMTGYPQTTLSDWENNKSEPSFTAVLKIAAALDVELSSLKVSLEKNNLS